MVAPLAKCGANLDAEAPGSAQTALIIAAVGNQPAVMYALVEAGAVVDYENAKNRTALMMAAVHGQVNKNTAHPLLTPSSLPPGNSGCSQRW
eukprot:6660906-Pyramimonas_sp.AAC.1